MAQADAIEGISALKENYGCKLALKVEELVRCWTKQPPDLDGLRSRAHQLAGTAPTFGYMDVGRLASEIERLLEDDASLGGIEVGVGEALTTLLASPALRPRAGPGAG